MQSIRHGFLAGTLAGVLLLGLLFIDQGPADQFILVAQTFGLDGQSDKWIAALWMLALAVVLGGIFGALVRRPTISPPEALLRGATVGWAWWAVLFLILGAIVERLPFTLFHLMLYFLLCVGYGIALGSLYLTIRKHAPIA